MLWCQDHQCRQYMLWSSWEKRQHGLEVSGKPEGVGGSDLAMQARSRCRGGHAVEVWGHLWTKSTLYICLFASHQRSLNMNGICFRMLNVWVFAEDTGKRRILASKLLGCCRKGDPRYWGAKTGGMKKERLKIHFRRRIKWIWSHSRLLNGDYLNMGSEAGGSYIRCFWAEWGTITRLEGDEKGGLGVRSVRTWDSNWRVFSF